MKNGKTNMESVVFGREGLKVTCIERKYRVSDSKVGFIITAKRELDEDRTKDLLHEDMELKTFLENYQITDIELVTASEEHVVDIKEKASERRMSISGITTRKNKGSARNNDIRVRNDPARIRNDGKSTKSDDGLIENHDTYKYIRDETAKRRNLFDSLNLKETFVIKDYKDALEKKGIVVTNTAMPYDDLDRFVKQGKIIRIGKGERGKITFMIKKKESETVV